MQFILRFYAAFFVTLDDVGYHPARGQSGMYIPIYFACRMDSRVINSAG